MKVTETLEWGQYVSPLSDKHIAPFDWYAFKHRFGSQLVSRIIREFELKKGDTILDPYCGGGTTLIKAKMDGINSVGLDLSPFPVFLSNVLTRTFQAKRLRKLQSEISHAIDPNVEIPDVELLHKSFSDQTLRYIFSLRNAICSLRSKDKDFFLFCLLCILDSVSRAKKSGGFLRITDQKRVPWGRVRKAFIETCEQFIGELASYSFSDAHSKAVVGDARRYPTRIKQTQYDAILTSPPYPNRHDYTRIYELELLVGFITDNPSLKRLRYATLRSHVEAKRKYKAEEFVVPELLRQKVETLGNNELNNPRIVSTLSGYFEDMYLCLKEMYAVLKPGKYVGLVVSNVRYAGIMIPVDELLVEIGEQVGLIPQSINVLRYRGNSSQQMAKHKREPSRESLIVWQK